MRDPGPLASFDATAKVIQYIATKPVHISGAVRFR